MKNITQIEKEVQNAPNVQLLTTLFTFQNTQSKSRKITKEIIEKELIKRGVIM